MQSNIYTDISFKQNFQNFMNWINKESFAKSEIIQNILIFLNAWLWNVFETGVESIPAENTS